MSINTAFNIMDSDQPQSTPGRFHAVFRNTLVAVCLKGKLA